MTTSNVTIATLTDSVLSTLDNANENASEMAKVNRVTIHCNAAKGEIVSIVEHDEESFRVGDASDNRSEERVTIRSRTFPTYSRTPGASCVSLARSMARQARSLMPSVPVVLFGA